MNKTKFKKKLLVLGMSLLMALGTVVTVSASDECWHIYENGVCIDCGTPCTHTYEDLHGQCAECYMECEHTYENGNCTKCGKFENECVEGGFYDLGYMVEANIEYNMDGPLTWNTYKFYDDNVKEVATLEVLHGYDYSKLWVTVNGVTQEFDKATLFMSSNDNEAWFDFDWYGGAVTIEGYEYEYMVLVSSETIPEMDVELEIVWDETARPGVVTWNNADDEGVVMYRLQLLQDGVYEAFGFAYDGEDDEYEIDFSPYINESGTYTVRLIALGDKNSGEKIVYSNEFVYEKPAEELGGVEKAWWTAKEGDEYPTILNWLAVPGAVGYKVNLAVHDEWGWSSHSDDIDYIHYSDEIVVSMDLSEKMEEKLAVLGSGWEDLASCTCEIKALSGDITVIANASSVYETTEEDYVLLEIVEEEILNNIEASTSDTILEDINNIGIDNMADAMQNNTEILGKIEELENDFTEKNKVVVSAPDGIKVVGAGLNATEMTATTGSSITIEFNEIENEKQINEKLFENAVQIDITLKENSKVAEGELKAPVTITMNAPQGVELEKLVILYYNADGDMEFIYPTVNTDNTITFSVTGFDTFVFANVVTLGADDTPDEPVVPDTPVEPDEPVVPDTPVEPDEPVVPDTPIVPDTPAVPDDYEYDPKDVIEYRWAGKEGWQKVNGTWYYFDANGELETGWVEDTDGKWYYMNAETGKMQTGWLQSEKSGLWYYMDTANGDMKSNGWLCDSESGRWYYLNGDGVMCTGWIIVDDNWYLLDENGAMCTGWNLVDGEWYLLGADGTMLKGWQTVDGKEYYLDENGKCLINTVTPDGSKVDEKGAKIK